LPRAAGLADELETRLGLRAELIKGSGGVFDVTVDGELIFSKKKTGRFPAPGEIERAIAARQQA
jgi:selenoprotein W-related protein